MAHVYEYEVPGITLQRFLDDRSFVKGIRGPFGSGKSSGCVMDILQLAMEQPVQKVDRRRHSRMVVVRNTYSELTTTTIKTWHLWVPESVGHWKAAGPPTHHIIDDNIDMEVIFLALDRPADVKKVLGFEITGAWINEAREVPKTLIDALTGRLGRYPSMRDGGCVNAHMVMDTNPPELNHWWYVLAERDTSTQANAELVKSVEDAEAAMRAEGLLGKHQQLFTFYAQPSALSPDAENRANLPSDYYAKLSAGKSEDFIKVYVRGEYGFVQDGEPVYPGFREQLHVKVFELNPKLPIDIGLDFGLTPAATVGQRAFTGIHRVRWEVIATRMGAKQMADALKGFLNQHCAQFEIGHITGDPSGESGSESDVDESCFKMMRANGVDARPAHTNEFSVRRETHIQAMSTLIDGEAGWQCHPTGCPTLRQGMAGKYRFKRVQLAGDARYHPKPDKNDVSHVCEADQYRMLGSGEGKRVLRGTLGGRRIRPAFSEM